MRTPLFASLLPCLVALVALTACGGDDPLGGVGGSSTATTSTTTPSVPPLADPGIRLARGAKPSCLKAADGTVTCADAPYHGAALEGITGATAVVQETDYGCAIQPPSKVSCWGRVSVKAVGYAVPWQEMTVAPKELAGVSLVKIASGPIARCGIEPSGQAVCWGPKHATPLGATQDYDPQAPLAVAGVTDAQEIAFKGDKACAVRAGGHVWCWGIETGPVHVTYVTDEARGIGVGEGYGCAVTALGEVRCWAMDEAILYVLSGVTDAVQVSIGSAYGCARRASGKVTCWHWTKVGGLERFQPDIDDAIDISVGQGDLACAVRTSGEAICWRNPEGLLTPYPG